MEEQISLYILTWNVSVNDPPDEETLKRSLGLDSSELPDLFIIGLQEVSSNPVDMVANTIHEDPWTQAYMDLLMKYGYVKVRTKKLVGISLNVFSLRKHVPKLRHIKEDHFKTGVGGYWGNKGAVGIKMEIGGCSFVFLNAHQAAHEGTYYFEKRLSEYKSITERLDYLLDKSSKSVTFWFGDLNYRFIVEDTNERALSEAGRSTDVSNGVDTSAFSQKDRFKMILSHIAKRNFSGLLQIDELHKAYASGKAYEGFIEKQPNFAPTFKYAKNCDVYDEKRIPAWTDRILYKTQGISYCDSDAKSNKTSQCICQSDYDSITSIALGDHRPVFSRFNVRLKDTSHCELSVAFDEIEDWTLGISNTVTCSMITNGCDQNLRILGNDWIGIFKEDVFSCLNNYVTYAYVNDSLVDERVVERGKKRIELKFLDSLICSPGRYIMIYFRSSIVLHDNFRIERVKDVLGVSDPFVVRNSRDQLLSRKTLKFVHCSILLYKPKNNYW
ncbi:hypothetical protein LSTR_LSTR000401 [Laodelphax striatellus]|uniref:Inositol polyphosphate-related phosphatase domain-containing protein n=1 Tax=Laodelphax striatellus TaxID=195883 RepID=A0A482X4B2_LAOST|nr:hypothetical protein LSTR_LSTR000401 [Laodelphax striatellus]